MELIKKGVTMARGKKNESVVEMDEEELNKIEATVVPEKKVEVIGSLSKPKLSGKDITARKEAEKHFPKIPVNYDDWVDMTDEEALDYQRQGILIGHDTNQGIGLLKRIK
jgi:hypothetical protein